MNARDLIPTKDQIEALQGIETEMLQRRRKGMLGFTVGVVGALAQVALAIAAKPNLITSIGNFFLGVRQFSPRTLLSPEVLLSSQAIGFYVIVVGFGAFFIYRKTSLLAKESKEPFQYTFWIEEFTDASAKEKNAEPNLPTVRLHLLHHDLMERLNDRIRRFSLLDEKTSEATVANARVNSHIHISGHYAVRKAENGPPVLHVMPRIRIGSAGKPATLAHPVKFSIEDKDELSVTSYDQMVERVYSSIATEVYKQIEADVKEKLDVFPTPYLRAVALFHEAEDFARSNTLDAYDRAIELYKESRRTFNLTRVKWFSKLMARVPFFWRFKVKSQHLQAKIEIGYAKCLIYRRQVSALTGRKTNPLYDIRESLGDVIRVLEQIHRKMGAKGNTKSSAFMAFLTFPRDSLLRFLAWRPLQLLFGIQRQLLFEAYVVSALTHSYLGSVKKAEDDLERAKAVDPQISEKHALYLLTMAEIEPDLNKEILLLRQATELAPDFQIAQYLLARSSQMRFRAHGELLKGRADSVLQEYARVLEINPGNIAALAAQGYLLWLLDAPMQSERDKYLQQARKKFSDGRDIKAIVADTFIGELNYGLARIAAEHGRFNTSYDLFGLAVTSDPGLSAFSLTASRRQGTSSYYEFIGPAMVKRYESFKNTVTKFCTGRKTLDAYDGEVSERVKQAVYSFVLNDYGCACLNYFFRFGDRERLKTAALSFQEAIKENPANVGASYNLYVAALWGGVGREISGDGHDQTRYLEEVVEQVPSWQAAVISLIQSHTRGARVQELQKKIEELSAAIRHEEKQARKEDEYVDDNTSVDVIGQLKSLSHRVRGLFRPAVQLEPQSSTKFALETGDPSLKKAVEYGAGRTYDDDSKKLQSDVEEAKTRSQKHKEGAAQFRLQLQDAEKQLQQLTQDTLARLAHNTKLSPLEFDYTGKHVRKLVSNKKIKWDRLDEYDVEALLAWAEAMSSNDQDRLALEASERLVNHILKQYHPDNFDAHWILKKVLDRMSRLAKDEKDNAAFQRHLKRFISFARANLPFAKSTETTAQIRQKSEEVIKSTIINWLKQDPINYSVLGLADLLDDQHQRFVLRALRLSENNDNYRANLVTLHRSNMWKYIDDKKYERALQQYEIAVKVAPNKPDIHSTLASDWILFPSLRVKALTTAISALHNGVETPPQPDVQSEAHHLERKRMIGGLFGERAFDWKPQTIPLQVIVYGDLRPHFLDNESAPTQACNRLTKKLFNDISMTMGVRLPRPQFINGGDYSTKTYVIQLHEIPIIASDKFQENVRLFPGSAQELEVLGVSGRVTANPRNGKEAVWVSLEDQKKIEDAGYKLWTIEEVVFAELEAVVRWNLADFLGVQEVMKLVEGSDQLEEVFNQIQQHHELLMELTAVLKRLVNEGVTITPLTPIVQMFLDQRKRKHSLTDIVEEIRSLPELLSRLPGNNDSYSYYQFTQDFEDDIHNAIWRNDLNPVLALEPDTFRRLSNALRSFLDDQEDVALVVEQAELRPFVRKLIEVEFPRVPVLARRELRLPNNIPLVAIRL